MKKIIVSAAVAAMALSTSAFALEDIKVNGQAKVWYETNSAGDNKILDLGAKSPASAEVVFKLGMTGKQGNVGFGAELTQGSTMGLEGNLVSGARTGAANADMFVSKAYITAPLGSDTIIKLGRQELNTPFAFTEKWNAMQNNFDAAVLINSSITNVTLIGAFVGQTNTDIGSGKPSWKAQPSFSQLHGGAAAVGVLYKADGLAVNAWGYHVRNLFDSGVTYNTTNAGVNVSSNAFWIDGSVKINDAATIKAYAAIITNDGDIAGVVDGDATSAFALSGTFKVNGIKLFAAGSMVSEGDLAVGNVATNFKKTKLPTAGVYTDGLFVAQPESIAFKVKASGKVASTGLALQVINNSNDAVASKETTEIDFIISQKVGVFNLKGLVMHRMFNDDTTENNAGGQHVRVIASVNF